MEKIAPECFKTYMDIATSCMLIKGMERPYIGEVEVVLEHALQLQESADASADVTKKDMEEFWVCSCWDECYSILLSLFSLLLSLFSWQPYSLLMNVFLFYCHIQIRGHT